MAVTGAVIGLQFQSAGTPLAFSAEDRAGIDAMRARYPQRASAVMPVLWLAQQRFGWISKEAIGLVAEALELPEAEVATVASFYSMYHLAPVGRHVVQVCCTLSCSVMGADALVAHLERRLGIHAGETTPNGNVTVKRVECLASCGTGPVIQIHEEQFLENVTIEDADRLLDELDRDRGASGGGAR